MMGTQQMSTPQGRPMLKPHPRTLNDVGLPSVKPKQQQLTAQQGLACSGSATTTVAPAAGTDMGADGWYLGSA